jgi:hypothetical protein
MQSVPITTNVVSSNPVHGEVYSIQHYVINFVSDLWQVSGFLKVLRFHPPKKLTPQYNWNIVKVALNTINQTKPNHHLRKFTRHFIYLPWRRTIMTQHLYYLIWRMRWKHQVSSGFYHHCNGKLLFFFYKIGQASHM